MLLWEEYIQGPVPSLVEKQLSKEQRDEITEIFNMYDVDGSGTVTFAELKDAMENAMGDVFQQKDLENMFAKYDDDDSWALELEEFMQLFREFFLFDDAGESSAIF